MIDLAGGTVRDAVGRAAHLLGAAGVASPRFDAEELACHVLGVQRSRLAVHLDEPAPPALDDLARQRASRVPLQHLTGRAFFRTVELAVGPGVFVPRPETEVMVGRAIEAASGIETPVVVDLGSGSGAIALAVATEVPQAEVHAVELDPGALPWLVDNVRAAGVAVHRADLSDCLTELDGQVDLVISNPPYIPVDAVPRDPEVARYDPPLALYSGPDGLEHIRHVERTAARLLRPGGWVFVEHADQQGRCAPQVFREFGSWVDVEDHQDLTGRDRFVMARRAPAGG